MIEQDTFAVPRQVGVMGGGRMGAGIAHAFLLAGADVLVVERDEASARSAQERVFGNIAASFARGYEGDKAAIEASLRTGIHADDFGDCELVIEAVPEILDLKLGALQSIERALAAEAVLASNTSSIPISKLAETLERPAQFLGLHFFNPVPASTLIEIVVHDALGEGVAEEANGWVRALGKTPITVADSPGFASSRLGVAIALEAIRMVEEGVASPRDIDLAMELGYKHPSGPLKTTDIVGLDVRLGIAEQLERDLGERFAPPKLLRDMVAQGNLGRKTGQGFYDWNNGS